MILLENKMQIKKCFFNTSCISKKSHIHIGSKIFSHFMHRYEMYKILFFAIKASDFDNYLQTSAGKFWKFYHYCVVFLVVKMQLTKMFSTYMNTLEMCFLSSFMHKYKIFQNTFLLIKALDSPHIYLTSLCNLWQFVHCYSVVLT